MTYTAMHDRYLAGQSHFKRTPLECYHWAMALRLFNCELSKDSRSWDQYAIWVAAALMSWITWFAVEAQNPEEVWPLSAASSSDIPWFPIQKGLKTLWDLLESSGSDSITTNKAFAMSARCLGLPPPRPGMDGTLKALADMCGLDEFSTAENNPYHAPVRSLSGLLGSSAAYANSIEFLMFVHALGPGFDAMLRQRDPRSLLLMAVWYGLVPQSAWWISLRASLERTAIILYLDRHHANDPLIHTVLASLRMT